MSCMTILFLNLQITRCFIRPHIKWAISLVIAYGHFNYSFYHPNRAVRGGEGYMQEKHRKRNKIKTVLKKRRNASIALWRLHNLLMTVMRLLTGAIIWEVEGRGSGSKEVAYHTSTDSPTQVKDLGTSQVFDLGW